MDRALDPSRPPSRSFLALGVRSIWELQAFLSAYPLLRGAPRGDGHPVLVLPGLAASDVSTRPLRTYLRAQGYAAHGWKQGPNHGARSGVEAGIDARLAELALHYNRKVSLIGWSLGGVFAREAARPSLDRVRQVITLGSPFANEPKASNAWRLYEVLSGRRVDDWPHREAMKLPPPVPSMAIYTRSDGIVAWQGCREQESATTEHRCRGQPFGAGVQPRRVVRHRRPACAAGRRMAAVRSQRAPQPLVLRSASSRRRWRCGAANRGAVRSTHRLIIHCNHRTKEEIHGDRQQANFRLGRRRVSRV